MNTMTIDGTDVPLDLVTSVSMTGPRGGGLGLPYTVLVGFGVDGEHRGCMCFERKTEVEAVGLRHALDFALGVADRKRVVPAAGV
jgi:hypothetical protein